MLKRINRKLVVGLTACMAFVLPLETFAVYIPPSDQVPPRTRGGTAGRRAPCEAEGALADAKYSGMTALAPISYLGKTASTHPTFVWFAYAPNALPVEFSLYEYDLSRKDLQPQPLFTKKLKNSPGITSFTLPKETPGLSAGKIYSWQVVLTCNTHSKDKNHWIRTPIELAEISPQLQMSLAATREPVAKLNLYAESGLWYDAIATALSARSRPDVKRAMLSLIQDLANVEKLREPNELPDRTSLSYVLQQIVTSEKQRVSLH